MIFIVLVLLLPAALGFFIWIKRPVIDPSERYVRILTVLETGRRSHYELTTLLDDRSPDLIVCIGYLISKGLVGYTKTADTTYYWINARGQGALRSGRVL